MQAEFHMITDLAAVAPKELRFNYDELKAVLQESLAQYKTQIVTPDTISEARADRAKLNKLKDGISSYRISVKKQLMEQYDNDFKPKCDELVSMVDEAASNIGGQIKAYEDAEAQSKIDAIRAVYDEGDAEVREFCPWERVYNVKWKNKGFSFDDAKDAVLEEFKKTREDLATIRTMDAQDVPALLLEYKRTRDLAAVVRISASLKQAHEEQKRREEAEERRKAEIEARMAAESAKTPEPQPELTEANADATPPQEEVREVAFKVWATARQLQSLKGFLRANGIKYGRA